MFKKLFCKHTYKYYNTRVYHPLGGSYGVNMFQFVCTKCGKNTEVDQDEIMCDVNRCKSQCNRDLALGKEVVKSSQLSIPRYQNCGVLYESPAATLVLQKYADMGIDLREIKGR